MAAFTGAAVGADADWSLCGEGFRIPERPASEAGESASDRETFRVSADSADLVEEGVSRLTGNVALEHGTRLLRSDEIVYDQPEGIIEAGGHVRYWDDGVFVAGKNARVEIETDVVAIERVTTYMLEGEHGHGEAGDFGTDGNGRMTASDATYTTCNPGDADWRISAGHLAIDPAEGTGRARDVWLRIMGQRLFYLPRLSFALSSRRKSGFLAPSWGSSEAGGLEVTAPFYFNLAPNYDATLEARAMSERGVQARGELRFLSRRCTGPAGLRPSICPPTPGATTDGRRIRRLAPARVVGSVVDGCAGRNGSSGHGVSPVTCVPVSRKAAARICHADSTLPTAETDGTRSSGFRTSRR